VEVKIAHLASDVFNWGLYEGRKVNEKYIRQGDFNGDASSGEGWGVLIVPRKGLGKSWVWNILGEEGEVWEWGEKS